MSELVKVSWVEDGGDRVRYSKVMCWIFHSLFFFAAFLCSLIQTMAEGDKVCPQFSDFFVSPSCSYVARCLIQELYVHEPFRHSLF